MAAWRHGSGATALSDGGNASGYWAFIIFGGVFALFGCLFVVIFFVAPLWRVAHARDWVQVPCVIREAKVGESHDSDGSTYRVEVRYEYRFSAGAEVDTQGRPYESTRYDMTEGTYSSGMESKQRIVAGLTEGKPVSCWVDPRHPDQAVIEKGMTPAMWLGAITLLFPAFGVMFMVIGIASGRRAAALRAGTVAISDEGRSGVGLTADAGTGASVDGPVELRPVSTRGAKLVIITVFAIFWNWIVALIAMSLGGSDWVAGLFLSVFGLVGIGLVIAVIHAALAFANPRVRLRVDRRAFHRGESFRLAWKCAGASDRIRKLDIILEGVEEATSKRGTSSSTDRHVFARIPIATLGDAGDMALGQADVRIPEAVMHSFASSNNRIVWRLAVRGEIPRWPDISDDYAITVLPSPITTGASITAGVPLAAGGPLATGAKEVAG